MEVAGGGAVGAFVGHTVVRLKPDVAVKDKGGAGHLVLGLPPLAEGAERGMADSVKSLYWALREQLTGGTLRVAVHAVLSLAKTGESAGERWDVAHASGSSVVNAGPRAR